MAVCQPANPNRLWEGAAPRRPCSEIAMARKTGYQIFTGGLYPALGSFPCSIAMPCLSGAAAPVITSLA
jgi:hypothetical protein